MTDQKRDKKSHCPPNGLQIPIFFHLIVFQVQTQNLDGTGLCLRPEPGQCLFKLPQNPKIWINGYEIPCTLGKKDTQRFVDPKFPVWEVVFPDSVKHSLSVAMRVEMEAGFYGGAAIPEPIAYTCSKGQLQTGDLFNNEALKTYSGGMLVPKKQSVLHPDV